MNFWCTFAKIFTWIPLILSALAVILILVNPNSLIPNPQTAKYMLIGTVVSCVIYAILLWSLYTFPDWCMIIGVIAFILFLANVAIAVMNNVRNKQMQYIY